MIQIGEIRSMTIYGYARVSTPTQNLERQVRNIRAEYPEVRVVSEAYTGTTMERPEWRKLLRKLKHGDIVVFDAVSRMARTAEEGYTEYMNLMSHGIELVFLKQHHIDTRVYQDSLAKAKIPTVAVDDEATDKMINGVLNCVQTFMHELVKRQIHVAFQEAEKEVKDLQTRTCEGIETARLNGKKIGRQHGDYVKTRKEAQIVPKIMKLSRDFGGSLTDTECIELLGIARNTYYKYKKIAKNS